MSAPEPRLAELRIARDQPARPPRRMLPIVLPLAAVILMAAAAWWWTRPKALTVHTVVVREAAAGRDAARTVLNASGYVTARREATVSSKVTGKVTEVLIEEGVRVTEGQVLARLPIAAALREL